MKIKIWLWVSLGLTMFPSISFSQHTVTGKILDAIEKKAISAAIVLTKDLNKQPIRTDSNGMFSLVVSKLPDTIHVKSPGYIPRKIGINDTSFINIFLSPHAYQTETFIVMAKNGHNSTPMSKLRSVEGTSIYESKKTEVINLSQLAINESTNNPREIFSRVSGLNVWDGGSSGGLQLSIGGRGLSPRRTSNFNVKQNGYDIAADAIGYPESYYTPPAEAVSKIEIIRGASSLQYGTQFGGVVNFRLKPPPSNKPIEVQGHASYGSSNFISTYARIAGSLKGLSYQAHYLYKQSDGWRQNSEFTSHHAFASLSYAFSEKMTLKLDYTHLSYLARQPGGLTDRQINMQKFRESFRDRNWFRVNWNIIALMATYHASIYTTLDTRFFSLLANRSSIGTLVRADREDIPNSQRDYLTDSFFNIGNETRLLFRYKLFGRNATFVGGVRLYFGHTNQEKGKGSQSKSADFYFVNSEEAEPYHYIFPSFNLALFTENTYHISPYISITPGIRLEHIESAAHGTYTEVDFIGIGDGRQPISKKVIRDDISKTRTFVILGIGASYTPFNFLEVYANISQNYRGTTFNDIRANIENFRIDPNLEDESGFNADLGIRGSYQEWLYYDATFFTLFYKGKIGTVFQQDDRLGLSYRYRTNVSDALILGGELLGEIDVAQLIDRSATAKVSIFSNISILSARYLESKESAYNGRSVEHVAPLIIKTGIMISAFNAKLSLLYSYVGAHFSDATNATQSSSGIIGSIASYTILDLSAEYTFKQVTLDFSINNLTDTFYFTRRAEGYPGPGIIPSDGRSFTITLKVLL